MDKSLTDWPGVRNRRLSPSAKRSVNFPEDSTQNLCNAPFLLYFCSVYSKSAPNRRPKAKWIEKLTRPGRLKRFLTREDGFVFILTILFLPVLFGTALLVIDLGRGNNAHSDLYAASDSLALTGARELDGRSDAIDRAKAAMEQVVNSVSMLEQPGPGGGGIPLIYEDDAGNEFTVIFLDDIPANDADPIDQAWVNNHATNTDEDAKYVYVGVQSRNLETIFFNPVSLLTDSVPISTSSVATYRVSACDVPPLFICNPFQGAVDLQSFAAAGGFYGRMIKLHPPGPGTAGPGNFGFLSVPDNNGGDAVRDFFAGKYVPVCYDAGTVTTKPGATVSVAQGLNTRFDLWAGPYQNVNPNSPGYFEMNPDMNVRKSYTRQGNACNMNDYDWETELATNGEGALKALGPMDDPALETTDAAALVAGASVGVGTYGADGVGWDVDLYWRVNHGTNFMGAAYGAADKPINPHDPSKPPSRRDIYKHEVEALDNMPLPQTPNLVMDRSNGMPANENGYANCGVTSKGYTAKAERREMFAAIIDCDGRSIQGSVTVPVTAFAKIFLVRPMDRRQVVVNGKNVWVDSTIDIEIIDITGSGGNGEAETVLRAEAYLVR